MPCVLLDNPRGLKLREPTLITIMPCVLLDNSVMANRIRTDNPRGFNIGRSSKFYEGSRVRQTPEEGRRTYWLKRCGNNNKDENNSPKTLND